MTQPTESERRRIAAEKETAKRLVLAKLDRILAGTGFEACFPTVMRVEVTADDVTKTDTMVHAWTIADAVRYLTVLAANMTKDAQPETQETPNA
jgi:hypothetical protein